MKVPIVTLSNGVKVANFSSPHDFRFTDGSVLPRVSDKVVDATSLEVEEKPVNTLKYREYRTVELTWIGTKEFTNHIIDLYEQWLSGRIDVIIMPLPAMKVLRKTKDKKWIKESPFRVVRIADRKTKKAFINKFCI